MAKVWQSILQYFDMHPWLAGLIGGAVAATVMKIGWTPVRLIGNAVIRWRDRRTDELIWQRMPRGKNTLSQLAPLCKLSPKRTSASLRRMHEQGRPVTQIHYDEEDWRDEIWHRSD